MFEQLVCRFKLFEPTGFGHIRTDESVSLTVERPLWNVVVLAQIFSRPFVVLRFLLDANAICSSVDRFLMEFSLPLGYENSLAVWLLNPFRFSA